MTVETLKTEIEKLDARSFNELRFWMDTLDDDEGDRNLRRAIEAGHFDEMAEQARRDHAAGNTRPLPTQDDLVEASDVA